MQRISASATPDNAIAIVGIGCALPGGIRGPSAFWSVLKGGIDLLDARGSDPTDGAGEASERGHLADVDRFDHRFFGFSRAEAKALDPQQRLLLEVVWHACEDAGMCIDRQTRVNAGVYMALHSDDYRILRARHGATDVTGQLGTARSGAACRVSHAFRFSGPSLTIDSDRASGLVAVQLACNALKDGECDIAVVGAANLLLLPEVSRAFERAGLLSRDGRCKFADENANGFVRSEAVMSVVLAPLARAVQHEHSRIYAVIRGGAVRHGGGATESFTAPSALAHEEAIREALARAGVAEKDVTYVEAHGTGTPVGDPIELGVLAKVYGAERDPGERLLVGSAKTNLGHTEAACGLVGLVKAALAIRHGEVPASLHFTKARPELDLAQSGLEVPTETRPWSPASGTCMAGVSAIGITGTVAHVVLAEGPRVAASDTHPPQALVLPLSAHSPASLRTLTRAWADRLAESGADAASLCRAAGRSSSHAERIAVSGRSASELEAALRTLETPNSSPCAHRGRASTDRKAVFVFSGHGSQWLGMGRDLLQEPVFRAVVERCDTLIRAKEGWSVYEELVADADHSRFRDTAVIQPVLVVFQLALAALWRHWGFEPAAVLGASMGEVSAAYVAGALDLEDALEIICHRSRLLRTTTGMGRLVVVECSPEDAAAAVAGHEHVVNISGFNSPRSVLLGGEASALAQVIAPFERAGVYCRYVNIDGTSHSPQVEGAARELRERLAHVRPRAEAIPFYSTVVGTRLTGHELNAAYWQRNLREPIQLMQALRSLTADGHLAFLEVSPHPMLWSSVMDNLAHLGVPGVFVRSLKRDENEHLALTDSVAALYTCGVTGDWGRIQGVGRRASDTPLYPFDRESLWFSDDPSAARRKTVSGLDVPEPPEASQEAAAGPAAVAESAASAVATAAEWRDRLRGSVARALDISVEDVNADVPFRELGLTSLMLTELRASVAGALGHPVGPAAFFDNPTIERLGTWLSSPEDAAPMAKSQSPTPESQEISHPGAIAIIGMACRFPSANNLDEFWSLLHSGTDAVSEIPSSRWDVEGLYDPDPLADGKMYSRWAGLIEHVDKFDAGFFGISPKEADAMDPQQRLLLETSWTALEHAGIRPSALAGTPAAVFVGMSTTGDYAGLKGFTTDVSTIGAHDSTGNAPSIAAGRLSYFLGTEGPSMTVDTACSSSLVATHLAIRSLRAQESSLAIVAGVNLILSPETSIAYCKTRMLSPRGRCRTFDASADGYVRGEGCGVLILKRLEDARRDGDTIHAILRGSAINQDGKSNGLTAPSGRAQQRVIERALADASVSPDQVGYLEAHGTGTPLGDPIELGAAGAVLGRERGAERKLFVGSVKTNIGHLEAAAGIAGVIKVVLSMRHGQIPPHLHLKQLNPDVDLGSGLTIPTTPTEWRAFEGARVAGVSSFGFSGTNAHVILESSAAPRARVPSHVPAIILPVAARTADAMSRLAARHADALRTLDPAALSGYAVTTASRRTQFQHRVAVIASTAAEAASALEVAASGGSAPGLVVQKAPTKERARIAFLFTGQGAQYEGMAEDLYRSEPVFRAEIHRCSELAQRDLGRSLRDILFGADRHLLAQTTYGQPATFALQYALVAQWRAWGVEPQAVLGHSLGEYGACVTAGALSLEDAMRVIVHRGRLMGNLANAGSAAVAPVDAARAAQFVAFHDRQASIAAYNAPGSVLIGGSTEAVTAIVEAMNAEGINARIFTGLIGVHSPMMDPILDELQRSGETISFRPLRMTLVSGLEGREVSERELSNPLYWRRHARQPVRYSDGVQKLLAAGFDAFVEIGSRHTLVRLGQAAAPDRMDVAWLPSLSKERHDRVQMLETAAELYVRGVDLNWDEVYGRERLHEDRVPTYPFEQERHWIAPTSSSRQVRRRSESAANGSWLGERLRSPLPELQFEVSVTDTRPAALAGHELLGRVVVPAAAYISRVAEAASTLGWNAIELRDLLFSRPLLPSNSECSSHLVLKPHGSDFDFEITSRSSVDAAAPWLPHASGVLRALESVPNAAESALEETERSQSGEAFYQSHSARGYALSSDFLWVERAWLSEGSVKGELRPIETAAAAQLPVGWLDSCIQLATHLGDERSLAKDEILMPVSIDVIRLHALPLHEKLLCHARLADGSGADDIQANVHVEFNGIKVLEIEGVRLRKVPRSKIVGSEAQPASVAAYELTWSPAEASTTQSAPTEPGRNGWIVLSRGDEIGAAVASELQTLGEEMILVTLGDAFRALDSGYEVAPDRLVDYQRLLAEALKRLPRCRGIIHLLGASPESDWARADAAALANEQRLGVTSLVLLASALTSHASEARPRIWAVTRGAQKVSTDDEGSGWLGAQVWGAGRVLSREHPDIWGGLVDLGVGDAAAAAERLLDELWSSSHIPEVALRDANRFLPRLAPRQLASAVNLDSDATYLITGGLGPLGLQVARFLVARGARHLILASRRIPQSADAELQPLRQSGTTVLTAAVDTTDEPRLTALFAQAATSGHPIRGIVHAAGVLDDAPALELTHERILQVMAPKTLGALALHRAAADTPLDFFVLFSSVAGLIGNEGQLAYAAANAFLDGFAAERSRLGRPTTSVSWGPWQGPGMAEHSAEHFHRRWGLVALDPTKALETLGHLLDGRLAHVAVLALDPEQVKERAAGTLLTSVVTTTTAKPTGGAASDALKNVFAAPPHARREHLARHVKSVLAEVLGAPVLAHSSEEQRLEEFGMDSLLAMDLARALQSSLKVTLPSRLLFDHPTAGAVIGFLARTLRLPGEGEESHTTTKAEVEARQAVQL